MNHLRYSADIYLGTAWRTLRRLAGTQRNVTLAEAIDYGRAVLRAKNTAEARRVSNQILCAAPRDANAVLLAAQTEATLGHFAVARLLANFTLGLAPQLDEALELKNALAALDARASTDEYTRQYLVNRAGHMDYPFAIQVGRWAVVMRTAGFAHTASWNARPRK